MYDVAIHIMTPTIQELKRMNETVGISSHVGMYFMMRAFMPARALCVERGRVYLCVHVCIPVCVSCSCAFPIKDHLYFPSY